MYADRRVWFWPAMAMADWTEVRRLAADFQRLQASFIAQRLSERNCVELVATLVKQGLVEIIYTLDGKEYITPDQLDREIRDELVVHGGRINIVDLQQILNVDLTHIESKVAELVKHDRSLTLLHGELIERSYMVRLCEETNDIIQETGQASLADLSRNFNLPIKYLMEHIEAAIGVQIRGHLDKSDTGIIYTESYVNRYRCRIRGVFHAITRPTAISSIITGGSYQMNLFNTVLHQLISSEELAGDLQGRQEKAVYIPHVYIHNQNKWTDSFLAANEYLEYDALYRLGIETPRQFISQRYSGLIGSGDLLLLSTCCLGKAVLSRVEGALEEVIRSVNWLDLMPLLPSPCTPSDAELLLHHVGSQHPDLKIFSNVVTTKSFLQKCCEHFNTAIVDKAEKVAHISRPLIDDEKAAKWKGGRKGGKIRKRPEDDQVKLSFPHKFMSTDEITAELVMFLPECPEHFLIDVASHIESSLQNSFIIKVHECVLSRGQSTPASQLRKKHTELQDKVQGLWNMLHLFEKAPEHFEGDVVTQLNRYLLRTLCTDLFDLLLIYVAKDHGLTLPSESKFSAKERSQVINHLPPSLKTSMLGINTVLSGKVVAEFFPLFEDLCISDHCGIMLKRPDKKKERQLLFSHQQSLLENLHSELEPSMALHLVVVILFQQTRNCAIHVSGKLLPQVIAVLQSLIDSELYMKVAKFEELLMEQRKTFTYKQSTKGVSNENENVAAKGPQNETETGMSVAEIEQKLLGLLDDLKQTVMKPKRKVK